MTKDEMAGWHHGLDGHEFEQALGVGDVQGGLASGLVRKNDQFIHRGKKCAPSFP